MLKNYYRKMLFCSVESTALLTHHKFVWHGSDLIKKDIIKSHVGHSSVYNELKKSKSYTGQ